ncbi:hypothetical protein [Paenibacillus luteus]|uniref:hypothetical protein n=1 Tax=Paenibacillus luteus TaxID=2545753 RepID=UPI0011450E18|nr:hypothetical protein [Paenibacillus luteus]
MCIIEIHHAVIVSIDKIGLIYTDSQGNQAQIQFIECRKLHSSKGYKHFRAICAELEANGWSTFDLG